MNHRIEKFKVWWQKPLAATDRFISSLMGMWAGIWLGCLFLVGYETQAYIENAGRFALYGLAIGAITGFIFPKGSRILFFPFLFFGVSCS